MSGAICNGTCDQLEPVEPSFIEDLLNCFLVNSNCSLFRDVVINELSKSLLNFTLGVYVCSCQVGDVK